MVVPAAVRGRVLGSNNAVITVIRQRCRCTSLPYYIDVTQVDGRCRLDVCAPDDVSANAAVSYITAIEKGSLASVEYASAVLAGSGLSSAEIARIETSTKTLIVLYKPTPERTLVMFAGHTLVRVNQAKEAVEKAVGMPRCVINVWQHALFL